MTTNSNLLKKFCTKHAYLTLILGLALVLRLWKIDGAFYGTVQELFRDLNVVYGMLKAGQWPLLGPSASVGGFYFGALYYYLLVPLVYLFGLRPIGAVLTSTVFSFLSLMVFYKTLWLWFKNKNLVLLGTFFLSISLYDVQNAYYISNPNPLPFFILSFLFLLTKIIEGSREWWLYASLGLTFGIATQLHATALIILPLVLFTAMLVARKNIVWSRLIITIVITILTYTPYIIYETIHNFPNLRRIVVVGGQQFSFLVSGQSLADILNFWQSSFIFTNGYFNLWFDHRAIYVFLVAIYFVALVFVTIALWRTRHFYRTVIVPISSSGKLLLSLWGIISLAVFLLFGVHKPLFYFLVIWPLPIILLTWSIYWIYLVDRKVFWLVSLGFFAAQMVQLHYFYRIVRNEFYTQKPFNTAMAAIVADAGGRSFNVVNNNLDQNMFVYYNKVNGDDKLFTKSQSPLLYIIGSDRSEYQVTAEPNPTYHQQVATFTSGHYFIKKYIYKNQP